MSNRLNLKQIWVNPSSRFVLLFGGVFTLLYYFNIFCIGITAPGNHYSSFLDQNLNYIRGLRTTLLSAAAYILRGQGYSVFTSEFTLHAYNVGGINVVYTCLGFGVMSFFTAFVIAWPGKSIKNKFLFLIFGLLGIQLLNLARFILITLYWKKAALPFQIDHHTIFNGMLYAILLAALYFWTSYNPQKPIAKKPVPA